MKAHTKRVDTGAKPSFYAESMRNEHILRRADQHIIQPDFTVSIQAREKQLRDTGFFRYVLRRQRKFPRVNPVVLLDPAAML